MDGWIAALLLFMMGVCWLVAGAMVRDMAGNDWDKPEMPRKRKMWHYIPAIILCAPFVLRLLLTTILS